MKPCFQHTTTLLLSDGAHSRAVTLSLPHRTLVCKRAQPFFPLPLLKKKQKYSSRCLKTPSGRAISFDPPRINHHCYQLHLLYKKRWHFFDAKLQTYADRFSTTMNKTDMSLALSALKAKKVDVDNPKQPRLLHPTVSTSYFPSTKPS